MNEKPNKLDLSNIADDGQLPDYPEKEIQLIHKDLIRPLEEQVRTVFNERKIIELRDSIRSLGQIEPIIVEASPDNNGFLIVAGERRWRAIKGIEEIDNIKCVVWEFNDPRRRFAIQLAENFDREDLTVIDRAKAVNKLIALHDGDIESAARYIGKSRSTLIKMSSVLQLPDYGRQFVDDGFTKDYSTISMLKTLCKADEKKAIALIDRYRRNQDERPIREALRDELDNLSTKKTKTTKHKQQTFTANEIYMQDSADKIYVSSRSGLLIIKLDKVDDAIRTALFDFLSNETTTENIDVH